MLYKNINFVYVILLQTKQRNNHSWYMGVVGHSYGGLGEGMDGRMMVSIRDKARRGWSHVERCRSTSVR